MAKNIQIPDSAVRGVSSPFDERDFEKPVPEVSDLPRHFSSAVTRPILDQKKSDFCTGFASFTCFCDHVDRKNRRAFSDIYTNETALQKSQDQVDKLRSDFWHKILRMEIWRMQGKNTRSALWHMNHGYTTSSGEKLGLGSYFRAQLTSPEDLCKYLYEYGSLFIAIRWRKQSFQKEILIGEGPVIGAHAMCLDGFDLDRQEFHVTNSYGSWWGVKGCGVIPFEKFSEILEAWIFADCTFNSSDKKTTSRVSAKTRTFSRAAGRRPVPPKN